MILEDLLTMQSSWDTAGIHCHDYAEYRRYFKFIRKAILDRHLPHYKVIGLSYEKQDYSLKGRKSFVNIEGNDSVGESYPEFMINLQDKIFLLKAPESREVLQYTFSAPAGEVVADTVVFNNLDGNTTRPLCKQKKICTVMSGSVIVRVHIYYGCGFMDMSKTSKLLSKDVFPFYVDYSLADFVRVLPPTPDDNSNVIRLRYYNGMSREVLISMLQTWSRALENIDFGKEEKLWLQSCEH